MSQIWRCAVLPHVTVVLRIKRSSGWTETHELPADGDYVVIPPEILNLSSDDVLGFDVDVSSPEWSDPAVATDATD